MFMGVLCFFAIIEGCITAWLGESILPLVWLEWYIDEGLVTEYNK